MLHSNNSVFCKFSMHFLKEVQQSKFGPCKQMMITGKLFRFLYLKTHSVVADCVVVQCIVVLWTTVVYYFANFARLQFCSSLSKNLILQCMCVCFSLTTQLRRAGITTSLTMEKYVNAHAVADPSIIYDYSQIIQYSILYYIIYGLLYKIKNTPSIQKGFNNFNY